MSQRMANGWALSKQSFYVLWLDKELLVFPLLSGVAILLALLSFGLPIWYGETLAAYRAEGTTPDDPLVYWVPLAFYFLVYFIIVFFNTALVACAMIRFDGGDPTLAQGLRTAARRLPQIVGWALLMASVGRFLQLLELKSNPVGRFVAGLMGMAWSAAAYFVVPVMVVEKVGPIGALRRSLSMLKTAWGEALVADFGIGLLGLIGALLAIVPAAAGLIYGSVLTSALGILTSMLLLIIGALISSATSAILTGALYRFAATGTGPDAFDENLLRTAFAAK